MNRSILMFLITGVILIASCIFDSGGGKKQDTSGTEPIFEREVAAGTGALIETRGYTIDIPPEALPVDTVVSAVPVPPRTTASGDILGGIQFGPSGTKLNKPARIAVPIEIPADWTPDELVPVYEFPADDPSLAVWNGYYADITFRDGKYRAAALVFHFSGAMFIRNCHSGTMEYILRDFGRKGCDPYAVIKLVKEKYPDMADIGIGTEKIEDREIQRILDTFFKEKYTYDRGAEVPLTVINELAKLTEAGGLAVIAFTSENWAARNAAGLYPNMAHTAILENKDGTVRIRNSANIMPNTTLLNALGGANTVYYDWSGVNEFRELQAGVGVELACGLNPGDLSESHLNPYGLSVYNPLEGKSWKEMAWEDPLGWLMTIDVHKLSGIPPRPKPWTAVKIYVMDVPAGINPCATGGESLTLKVDIPGYVKEDIPYGKPYPRVSINEKHPGIFMSRSGEDAAYLEFLMDLNKGLKAGGTYTSFSSFIWGPGVDCAISFQHAAIKDATGNSRVVFNASKGTLTLDEFGVQSGDIISGSFSVKIIGARGNDSQGAKILLEGSMTGTFRFRHP